MTDTQRPRSATGLGFLLVVLGLIFFAGVALDGRLAGPLAMPGALITTVGLILLYQSTFDRYQTWAYAWTLLVVAGGVGLLIDAAWRNRPERAQLGRAAIGVGA